MSNILKTILKYADIDDQKRGESRQDFLKRCVLAVSDLSDKDYKALDKATVDWFNAAADVIDANKKKDKPDELPDFPDLEREEAAPRRRSSDDSDKPGKGNPEEARAVKVGMKVTLTTQKGREYVGEIVELDKKGVVLNVDGREKEFDYDGEIGSIAIFNDGAGKEEAAAPKAPGKGDTVSFTTKRGREVKGQVVKIDDEEVVVKTAEGEEEFLLSRIDGEMKVVGGGKEKAKEEDAAPRRRSSDDSDKPAKDGKGDEKLPRSRNEGVSIGTRIKELILDNPDATVDDIAKSLKKEGLEYRDNTLSLNFKETHKLIELMKDRGWKKAK